MRAARAACDEVVVSLFVNPAQFEEAGDLAAYPRDEARDAAEAAALGVDVLFAPSRRGDVPGRLRHHGARRGPLRRARGRRARPRALRRRLHGRGQAAHVVAPDVAYFGQKDAQQVAVLQRMVRDLDLPRARSRSSPPCARPTAWPCPAATSRLGAGERERAVALSRALRAAEEAIARGERDAARLRDAARPRWPPSTSSPSTSRSSTPTPSSPIDTVNGRVLVAVAARLGETRLIDNALIEYRRPEESPCPPLPATTPRAARKPITLMKLAEKRALGEPIVMVTAYDHPSAVVARRPAWTSCWSATRPPTTCSATPTRCP